MTSTRHPPQFSPTEGNEEDGPPWSISRPIEHDKASKMSGASALADDVHTGGEHQQSDSAQAEGAVEAQPAATRTSTESVADYCALPDALSAIIAAPSVAAGAAGKATSNSYNVRNTKLNVLNSDSAATSL